MQSCHFCCPSQNCCHGALEGKSLLMQLGLPGRKRTENSVGLLLMSVDDLASCDAISSVWCYNLLQVIFDICQVEDPAQEWKLIYQKLGFTEIFDFQVHGHIYKVLRRPFSLVSTPEGSSTYLHLRKTKCEE